MLWAYHNIVARFDGLAVRKVDGVLLDDLFDDRLRRARQAARDGREASLPEPLHLSWAYMAGM